MTDSVPLPYCTSHGLAESRSCAKIPLLSLIETSNLSRNLRELEASNSTLQSSSRLMRLINNKLPLWLAFLACTALTASAAPSEPAADYAAPTGLEWQQEQNLSLNKEPARATFMSFPDLDSALKILPENSKWWKSLDGEWKFNWAKDPDSRPKDFYKPDFDVKNWSNVKVPCSWQAEGITKEGKRFGTPIYCNQPYPFARNWPFVMDTPPENFTNFNERNPVGSYRTNFEVPASWDGREVYMQFDGVDSFFYLWINGQYVGFSKDARNPALFDISPYLKKGENVVAVEVYRHSDGAYLECQDMFRLSGIFRTVSIFSLPKVHIRDYFVHVAPENTWDGSYLPISPTNPGNVDGTWRVLVDVDLQNLFPRHTNVGEYTVSMAVYDSEGKLVTGSVPKKTPDRSAMEKKVNLNGQKQFKTSLIANYEKPKLWSAEEPNLYTLVLELKDKDGKTVEVVSSQLGFRNVVIKDSIFLVNGKPVKVKGVNRHESTPQYGHYVPREMVEEEIFMMKRANINHVRCSHYPADPYFYYLCNKYGIYVQDEANIESHGYYYGEASISHPLEWLDAHVDRIMSMVERNKNNPCIVMWSLGNEAGPGRNFQIAEKTLKARDLSRPTHYERNNSIVDLGSNQYPSVGWTQGMAKNKDFPKPYYISEYAHNMNNAMGNLADYWDAIESSDRIMGGAIWDWVDQGLYLTKPDGSKILAYGGDFGDEPNSGQFVFNGVILSDRTPEPGYTEVQHVYQNIKASLSDDGSHVKVFNKNFFIDLSGFEVQWTILRNGLPVSSGELKLPDAGPRQTVSVPADFLPKSMDKGAEYALRVEFKLKKDEDWAQKGYALAYDQIALANPNPEKDLFEAPAGQLKVSADKSTITGKNFSVKFDPQTGALSQYTVGKTNLLKAPMQVNAYRCASSNEVGLGNAWAGQGLRDLEQKLISSETTSDGKTVTIRQSYEARGKALETIKNFGGATQTTIEKLAGEPSDANTHFVVNCEWTIYADGTMAYQSVLLPRGRIIDLPRIGYELQLPASFSNITYYGAGPVENYPDRKTGTPVGVYKTTTKDSVVNYGRGQDTGNREDTRWVALTSNSGNGLLVGTLGKPFAFSAIPYTATELTLANHTMSLPKSTDKTVLVLSAAVRGLGGASCGPGPMERDIIKSNKPYFMSFSIRPFTKQMEADTIKVPEATLDATMKGRDQSYVVKYVSSQEPGEEAEKAVDGDPNTHWHSQYGVTLTKYPHTLEVDLGKETEFQGVTYLPRQDGSSNGRIAKYSISISKDGKTWEKAAEGTFDNNAKLKEVLFKQNAKVRYFQFNALSEVNGNDYASAAEITIIPVKKK